MSENTMMLLGAGFPMVFKGTDFKIEGKSIPVCTTDSITKKIRDFSLSIYLNKKLKEDIVGVTNGDSFGIGVCYNVKVGEILFDMLNDQDLSHKPNFETIINALETMFYWYQGTSKELNSLFKTDNNLSKIIEDISYRGGGIQFGNTGSVDYCSENAKGMCFIAKVYEEFIGIIINDIAQYNYAVSEGDFSESKLQKYVDILRGEGPLHVYTTNYDDTFNYLFPGVFFNGFKTSEGVKADVDIDKILDSITNNYCYNLHGSIFFVKEDRDSNRYYYKPDRMSQYRFRFKGLDNGNPDEMLLSAQIITGYRKSQRILQHPFSLFYNSFERDIYSDDKLVIIGYSFGDPHLNRNIIEALEKGIKAEIVTFGDGSVSAFKANLKDELNIDSPYWDDNVKIFLGGIDDYLGKKLK